MQLGSGKGVCWRQKGAGRPRKLSAPDMAYKETPVIFTNWLKVGVSNPAIPNRLSTLRQYSR